MLEVGCWKFKNSSNLLRTHLKITFMATITRFEDLENWRMAREQANEIFKLAPTEKFSKIFLSKIKLMIRQAR
jgi:hypothetical protein